jgi:hypothetical protein
MGRQIQKLLSLALYTISQRFNEMKRACAALCMQVAVLSLSRRRAASANSNRRIQIPNILPIGILLELNMGGIFSTEWINSFYRIGYFFYRIEFSYFFYRIAYSFYRIELHYAKPLHIWFDKLKFLSLLPKPEPKPTEPKPTEPRA